MDFDPKSETQLDSLDDDELIDHISAARNAGNHEQMRSGLAVFVWRRHDQIVNRIRLKVDSDHDVEDLAMQVISDVMAVKFKGEHAGELVNLITTVTKRRIADFYDRRDKRGRDVPLPDAGSEDEQTSPEIDDGEDFTKKVELAEIVTRAIDELSDSHALVVRLSLASLPAEEVAAKVNGALELDKPMTGPNVHQINKRFRDRIAGVLEESER